MMKNLILLCFMASVFSTYAMPQDSIGVKVLDGKTYIMHKVTKGEGVYGIGKRYGVSASDIFAANEGSDKTIKIGQVLLIPKSGLSTGSSGSSSAQTTTSKTEKVYHTVSSGQTLSSIARQYQTTVAEIKSLNKLKSDNITLGQKLIVGEKTVNVVVSKPTPAETPVAETPKPQPKPVPAEIPKKTDVPAPTSNNVVVNPEKQEDKPVADKPGQVVNTYSTDDGDEISENGLAVISSEGELNQDRSFILHPTAKIGTIVMIVNPTNNSTVFARVIGNCKAEDGVILKMSKTVAGKLGVSENTEVKLSYAK